MNFKNKVVWITGASSGIGRALALELAAKGDNLILSSRNKNTLKEVKQLCRDSEKIRILPLDLEAHDSLTSKAFAAISLFGRVDVLVNNGGVSQRSLVKDTIRNYLKKCFVK